MHAASDVLLLHPDHIVAIPNLKVHSVLTEWLLVVVVPGLVLSLIVLNVGVRVAKRVVAAHFLEC